MNELIKLTQQTLNDEVVNTVNARELYEFLESKRGFSKWIKERISQYDFIENQDYICLGQNCPTQTSSGKQGVSFRYEYFITLDMAKELAMVERNQKGKEARKYFIECEKKLHKVVSAKQNFLLNIISAEDDLSRALAVNAYEVGYVKPLEQFKEQALPKVPLSSFGASSPRGVRYYDNVLNSPGLVTITQIAKEGYTQSSTYITEYGSSKLTTKWTQKGRLFIYEKLKSERSPA